MTEQVLALAGEMAGGAAFGALLEPLCEAAVERWKRRLPDGMAAEDCGTAFVCAAAFTVAADLLAGQTVDSVGDFTAGEISVKSRSAADTAMMVKSLRQAAEELMAPYAASANFAFRGVRG